MVKEKKIPTYALDSENRCAAVEYPNAHAKEQVTVPDYSPSLVQMVTTGTVGSMTGNSKKYFYEDLDDDDELAHDAPDYEKIQSYDIVEKKELISQFIENNEKENDEPKVETKVTTENADGEEPAA